MKGLWEAKRWMRGGGEERRRVCRQWVVFRRAYRPCVEWEAEEEEEGVGERREANAFGMDGERRDGFVWREVEKMDLSLDRCVGAYTILRSCKMGFPSPGADVANFSRINNILSFSSFSPLSFPSFPIPQITPPSTLPASSLAYVPTNRLVAGVSLFPGGNAMVCSKAVEMDWVRAESWEGEREVRVEWGGYGGRGCVVWVID